MNSPVNHAGITVDAVAIASHKADNARIASLKA